MYDNDVPPSLRIRQKNKGRKKDQGGPREEKKGSEGINASILMAYGARRRRCLRRI